MADFDGVSGGEDPDAASGPGSNGPTSGLLDPSTFPPAAPDKAAPDGSNISVQPIETEIADGPPLERSAPLISGPLDTDTHAEVLRDIQNAQAQLPPVSPRSVYSLGGGVVSAAGWQKPNNHGAGMGWRVYVTEPDGSRIGYGHMDPSSTPSVGMQIQPGGLLG